MAEPEGEIRHNTRLHQSSSGEEEHRPDVPKYVIVCKEHKGPTLKDTLQKIEKETEIKNLKFKLMEQVEKRKKKEEEIQDLKTELKKLHETLLLIDNRRKESSFETIQSTHENDFQSTIHTKNDDSGFFNSTLISETSSQMCESTFLEKTLGHVESEKQDNVGAEVLGDQDESDQLEHEEYYDAFEINPIDKVEDLDHKFYEAIVNMIFTDNMTDDIMASDSKSFQPVDQEDLKSLKVQEKYQASGENPNEKLNDDNARDFNLTSKFDQVQDEICSSEDKFLSCQEIRMKDRKKKKDMIFCFICFFFIVILYQYFPSLQEYICDVFKKKISLGFPLAIRL